MIDDHDQIRKGNNKARFCANDQGDQLILSAMGLNLCTLGIPCIYYGSEQKFDGSGNGTDGADRYIREAMFGGEFGAFRSRNRHCFDEDQNTIPGELAKITKVRQQEIALRRGRQYLRQISGDGSNFGFPKILNGRMRSIVAWSRIIDEQEVLAAVNTDPSSATRAWVTVDQDLHRVDSSMRCLYSTENAEIGNTLPLEARNGKAVNLTVPPGGFAIYK